MRIVEIIRSCVFPLTGNPLLHTGQKWLQNVKADNVAFPCVFLDRPIQWKPAKVGKYAYRQEVYSPVMLFAEKSRPEWTQEQHDEVIERQRVRVGQFLETLDNHPDVDVIVGEPQCVDLMNFLDQNLTGVSLQFVVRLNVDAAVCPQVPLLPSNPIITSINPTGASQNSITSITLTGTGFVTGCIATINGTDIVVDATVFNSATEVDVDLTIDTGAPLGTRSVTITNPDGISFTLDDCLTITA